MITLVYNTNVFTLSLPTSWQDTDLTYKLSLSLLNHVISKDSEGVTH